MKKNKQQSVVVPQQNPKVNNNEAIWDLVLEELKERDENGLRKYGTRLQAFNGRNAIIDAFQESADLLVYLRQAIEEKKEIISLLKKISKATPTEFEALDLGYEAFVLLTNLGEI